MSRQLSWARLLNGQREEFIYILPTTPEELTDILHELKIPEVLLPALKAAMQEAPVFDHHVDDDHLCALLRDAHTDM